MVPTPCLFVCACSCRGVTWARSSARTCWHCCLCGDHLALPPSGPQMTAGQQGRRGRPAALQQGSRSHLTGRAGRAGKSSMLGCSRRLTRSSLQCSRCAGLFSVAAGVGCSYIMHHAPRMFNQQAINQQHVGLGCVLSIKWGADSPQFLHPAQAVRKLLLCRAKLPAKRCPSIPCQHHHLLAAA